MAILKNAEVWFTKLDPKRPSKALTPLNPTWEIQIRTNNKDTRKEWEAMGIKVKVVRADKADDESPVLYYSANLKRKSLKVTAGKTEPNEPPTVENGKGESLDPTSIGNGSVANIRIFQSEYTFEGKKGVRNTLMGIQLVKHKVYVQKPMEEFDAAETETILPDEEPTGGTTTGSASADDDY